MSIKEEETGHNDIVDSLILVGILLLGVFAGCRSLTPPAVVAWGAHAGLLQLGHSRLSWLAALPTVILFSLMAFGELICDKLPNTPSRKQAGPFVFRLLTGGLSGAALANAASISILVGAGVGALGAVIGTLGGYEFRMKLFSSLKLPDWPVALLEDVIVVGGSILVITRF